MSHSPDDAHTDTPPEQVHVDPGLQPERTTLAWGRTVLAFITAAAMCLRWVAHHGPFVLVLFAVAAGTSLAVYGSQQARYRRSCSGITTEQVAADVPGILGLATASVALGVLGLYMVLVLA